MRTIAIIFTFFILPTLPPLSTTHFGMPLAAQNSDEDALFIRKIYDAALTQSLSYPWLSDMCKKIGGRLSGSPKAARAVQYTRLMLDTTGFLTRLQPCMVPRWVRGEKEVVKILSSKKGSGLNLRCLAIGNSVGTGPQGITAEVI